MKTKLVVLQRFFRNGITTVPIYKVFGKPQFNVAAIFQKAVSSNLLPSRITARGVGEVLQERNL